MLHIVNTGSINIISADCRYLL